jgi:hypothetical protein
MKRNALILAAALALLTASAAHAQESSRLSAEYLRQATPLTHWPPGLEPRNVDVFVHNEGWIDANSADVRIDDGLPRLAQGMGFDWKTFGFPIRSTVDVFEPNHEIGWSVDNPQFRVHHAWVLVPERGGTRVITEEGQKGADAIRFRLEQPNAMYDAHDWWISALKVRSERMARR